MEANTSVWLWKYMQKEVRRWVGLPHEHPVYWGGPEDPLETLQWEKEIIRDGSYITKV